jgi:hypothetical protein
MKITKNLNARKMLTQSQLMQAFQPKFIQVFQLKFRQVSQPKLRQIFKIKFIQIVAKLYFLKK